MNFYKSWRRLYVQFDFRNPYLGTRFAIGRWPKDVYVSADQYAADDVPHPSADPDALTGNITTPVGAQSGEVIDVTKGPYVPNPVNQHTGD